MLEQSLLFLQIFKGKKVPKLWVLFNTLKSVLILTFSGKLAPFVL
jgi:hypothetical protein